MVMILTCSKCATRYHVDPASLGAEGRAVRCASCGHRWTARPPADAPKVFELSEPGPRRPAARAPGSSGAGRRGAQGVLAWLVGALVILVLASAAVGRNEIVASFPASAPIYRALGLPVVVELGLEDVTSAQALGPPVAEQLGLEFEDITSERLVEGGVSVVVVKGEIVNQTKQARSVPPIRLILLDDGGRQLHNEIFRSKETSLDAGGKTSFSGRLVNPPSRARNFSITFDIDS